MRVFGLKLKWREGDFNSATSPAFQHRSCVLVLATTTLMATCPLPTDIMKSLRRTNSARTWRNWLPRRRVMRKLQRMWPSVLSTVKCKRTDCHGFIPVESSTQLLAPCHLLLTSIRGAVGIPERHWQDLYVPVFHNYAALCQRLHQLRGTSSRRAWRSIASRPGDDTRGTDTASEPTVACRRTSREIANQQDLWTYATVTAALLHDVGKPITDPLVTYISPADTAASVAATDGRLPGGPLPFSLQPSARVSPACADAAAARAQDTAAGWTELLASGPPCSTHGSPPSAGPRT